MEKLRTIVDRIAKDERYTIIFDASNSGIIYADDKLDITQQVITEMNKMN
jgi:Skp family chaperone for outer membrane proteins